MANRFVDSIDRLLRVWLSIEDVELSSTKSARHFDPDILVGESQFLLAMRALGIDVGLGDPGMSRVKSKVNVAELALHSLTEVLAVDLQFLMAFGAGDKQTHRLDFDHRIEFFERDEDRNLDAVVLKFGIEQRSTSPAVNHAGRHVIATFGAWATGPGWHSSDSRIGSRSWVLVRFVL